MKTATLTAGLLILVLVSGCLDYGSDGCRLNIIEVTGVGGGGTYRYVDRINVEVESSWCDLLKEDCEKSEYCIWQSRTCICKLPIWHNNHLYDPIPPEIMCLSGWKIEGGKWGECNNWEVCPDNCICEYGEVIDCYPINNTTTTTPSNLLMDGCTQELLDYCLRHENLFCELSVDCSFDNILYKMECSLPMDEECLDCWNGNYSALSYRNHVLFSRDRQEVFSFVREFAEKHNISYFIKEMEVRPEFDCCIPCNCSAQPLEETTTTTTTYIWSLDNVSVYPDSDSNIHYTLNIPEAIETCCERKYCESCNCTYTGVLTLVFSTQTGLAFPCSEMYDPYGLTDEGYCDCANVIIVDECVMINTTTGDIINVVQKPKYSNLYERVKTLSELPPKWSIGSMPYMTMTPFETEIEPQRHSEMMMGTPITTPTTTTTLQKCPYKHYWNGTECVKKVICCSIDNGNDGCGGSLMRTEGCIPC
jgi:hypothetical protein